MDFLQADKRKIVRTRLYGDQEFTQFELELLHTPMLQRLYDLKQLGFTDRVYPDAIHSRFNHILGAVEIVDRMATRLSAWLNAHGSAAFRYARHDDINEISGKELSQHLRSRLHSLRLMALLHDVTHAAFGHTLEDEVNVFDEKHDNQKRQIRFFNALVAQAVYIWCTERGLHTFNGAIVQELSILELSPGFVQEKRWAEELAEHLPAEARKLLAGHLRDLEFAFRLLLQIEFAHEQHHEEPVSQGLLLSEVAKIIDVNVAEVDFAFNRDLFMIDLVGNTICADLLDYARRDADNAGLRVQFDDRFLRYLSVVSVKEQKLSPTEHWAIRIAVQIFTDKMRYDVLSEISGILKARYLINERVLFHPTKCAAGAMLGTAVQLLGLRDIPGWMQVLGDREFLSVLCTLASNIDFLCSRLEVTGQGADSVAWSDFVDVTWCADKRMAMLLKRSVEWMLPKATASQHLVPTQLISLRDRATAANAILWRLQSRRFPKVAYRLRTVQHSGGDTDETIARTYCDPKNRYVLEREIELDCKLPMGSIVIHCPKRMTSMKVAAALVVGADLDRVTHLRTVAEISREGLEPYQKEIIAVEEMYRSIWQFHAFLDFAHWDKQPLVEWAFERRLREQNDGLLQQELRNEPRGIYHTLSNELREEIAPILLPAIVDRIDTAMRARGEDKLRRDPVQWLRAIIREVSSESPGSRQDGGAQLGLPGV